MKLSRPTFLASGRGDALPALPGIARAQAYPTRRVHIIVFVAAGGSPDISSDGCFTPSVRRRQGIGAFLIRQRGLRARPVAQAAKEQ